MSFAAADPVGLSMALIERASVTPVDAGCQAHIAELLLPLGCEVHWLHAGEVSNVFIRHANAAAAGPHLMFLGHTDVVPPGDLQAWQHDPFQPLQREGRLYGRGSADMKGAVAAMVVAIQRYLLAHPDHPGTVSLLLTSDEEGPADDGIRRAAQWLAQVDALPDYCLVGEPSSQQRFGDTMRIGRRGSVHGRWVWRGVQGHTAYTAPADNPLHRALVGLAAVTAQRFDDGSADFPPTCLNLVKVHSDSGANNITPSTVEAAFNIRNNPASPPELMHERLSECLTAANATPDEFHWKVSGEAFMSVGEDFRQTVAAAVRRHTGITPEANTGGGTSDGRFLAPLGAEVVEFGLLNTTIHQVDECTELDDIVRLAAIYQDICHGLLHDEELHDGRS